MLLRSSRELRDKGTQELRDKGGVFFQRVDGSGWILMRSRINASKVAMACSAHSKCGEALGGTQECQLGQPDKYDAAYMGEGVLEWLADPECFQQCSDSPLLFT